MRILIVALDFKPLLGGVAEYTHQIARHLQEAGDEVTVLSKKTEGSRDFDSTCPYRVERHDFRGRTTSRLRRHYANFRAISDAATRVRSDVILSNHLLSEPHLCWLASRLMGLPYGVFVYGLELGDRVQKPFRFVVSFKFRRALALRGADWVFCCSSYTRGIVEKLGVKRGNTVIVPPILSMRDLSPPPVHSMEEAKRKIGCEDKTVILTLGRVVERKGIDQVILSLERIRQDIPNVHYVVAGEGPHRAVLQTLAKELDMNDVISFTGYIAEEQKGLYYSAADVFVMPNRELDNGDVEGFGIVFLEANAYGVPVVGGMSGGATDAIADGETGLLVTPTDTAEISSALLRLLQDPDYARQLGIQGRQRVKERFNGTRVIAAMRAELARCRKSSESNLV